MAKRMKVEQFDNRTRFNWGYHDAAQTVREGWEGRNFGFGPTLKIEKPEDVLAQHTDKDYANGWMAGYGDAKAGNSTESSEEAWLKGGAA